MTLCQGLTKDEIKKRVKAYPDWPKPGVTFYDIFSILADLQASSALWVQLSIHATTLCGKVDAVVGLGSRGFLIGPQLAQCLNVPFVPVRKDGELPGPCITDKYAKEYGESVQAMQVDSLKPGSRVIIVDDLLATGGSMASAARLVHRLGGSVVEFIAVFGISELNGAKNLDAPVHTLIDF